MLNFIWLGLVLAAVLIGGFAGKLKEVADGAVKGAETAVTISIGLIGIMALWLGLMRLAEKAGLVQVLARWLRPVMVRLFPDVPPEHPAMGSMLMNIAANALGLLNAATPLGLRAMKDLESLNKHPGTATNAMCTFLAINTGSIQLIPITSIAILAGAGSKNPSAIIGTTLLATACSSAAGLIAVKLLEKLRWFRLPPVVGVAGSKPAASTTEQEAIVSVEPENRLPSYAKFALIALVGCFAWFVFAAAQNAVAGDPKFAVVMNAFSVAAIPFLLVFFPLYAAFKKIKVYEEMVEGAKEGFNVAIRIIPYLVVMLAAIMMFRNAGGIDLITRGLNPLLQAVNFPSELVPLALMRPLSGSGSLAIFSDIVKALGPDHIVTRMAGTLYGSTETTFYVIAVYFGAVSVYRTRHAVPAGLVADLAGTIAAVIVCRLVFG